MNRRGFLKGLLASAALVAAPTTVSRAVLEMEDYRWESYTTYFYWRADAIDSLDWRYVARIANIEAAA